MTVWLDRYNPHTATQPNQTMKHPQDLSASEGHQLMKVNKVEKMKQELAESGKCFPKYDSPFDSFFGVVSGEMLGTRTPYQPNIYES